MSDSEIVIQLVVRKSPVIAFNPDKCVGCGTCMFMCSLYHEGVGGISLARIQMDRDPINAEFHANVCQQCLAPSCYAVCNVRDQAFCIDKKTGARYINPTFCIACDDCYVACPFFPKHVRRNLKTAKAYKCDLCRQRPEGPICVEYCPMQALSLVPAEAR